MERMKERSSEGGPETEQRAPILLTPARTRVSLSARNVAVCSYHSLFPQPALMTSSYMGLGVAVPSSVGLGGTRSHFSGGDRDMSPSRCVAKARPADRSSGEAARKSAGHATPCQQLIVLRSSLRIRGAGEGASENEGLSLSLRSK
jgi:hypothetical protein